MNYFTIYESIFEPIDNGASGSIRRALVTIGFSKTMKDVRFGDLADPSAMRSPLPTPMKKQLVKQEPGQVRVFADARQLRQVPIRCGRVQSVSNSKAGALRSPVSPCRRCNVTVSDDGVGIAADDMRVLDPSDRLPLLAAKPW